MSRHNQSNKAPQITEKAKLTFFKLGINDLNIRAEDIIDIQINIGTNGKRGILTFVDTTNVNELAPLTVGNVTIAYQDSLEGTYTESFMITEVEVVRLKNNIINTKVYFEDQLVNILKKTYISKAYSDVKFSEVISDLLTELELPAQVHGTEAEDVYEFLVVPKNMSLWEFFQKQMPISNMFMYATKQGSVFAVKDVLDFARLSEVNEPPFKMGSDDTQIYWSVLEYRAKLTSPNTLLKAPITLVEYIDEENIGVNGTVTTSIATEYPSQELNESFGLNDTTIINSTPTYGQKTVSSLYMNSKHGITDDYRDVINESQEIEITVHGLNIDRMYSVINVVLPRPTFINDVEDDEVYSGLYVVVGYTDKIVGKNFIQHLTLKRSDYLKGNQSVQ